MEKLKLPIVRGPGLQSKQLSMDDYLKFVMFNLKYIVDKKAERRRAKKARVNVPFVL